MKVSCTYEESARAVMLDLGRGEVVGTLEERRALRVGPHPVNT